MTERAAHAVDWVLPHVPVRQWVLSLPHELRYLLAWDHGLCRAVLAVYVRALLGFQRWRARRLGLGNGRSGSLTVIQRFGGALNINIHFHTLVLDGVFTNSATVGLQFQPLPPPTDTEVGRLVTSIRARVLRLLARRGLGPHTEVSRSDPVREESPALAGLSVASVQGRVALGPRAGARAMALGRDPEAHWVISGGPRHAHHDGFDLHANVTVRARTVRVSNSFAGTSCGRRSRKTGSGSPTTAASCSSSRPRGRTAPATSCNRAHSVAVS